MSEPKKRKTKSKTKQGRSHLLAKLRRAVNRQSPVKALSKRQLRHQAQSTMKSTAKTKSKPNQNKQEKDHGIK